MRWIAKTAVEGFAWMLGASAAKDTYASLKEPVERDEAPPPAPSPEAVREAAAKAAKVRAAAKKKLEREVDAELRALKKKLKG